MMNYLDEYLKLNVTHKMNYLKNNKLVGGDDSVEKLFYNIDSDLDLILNALKVSSNKTGFKYWKDSVFIFILSEKIKVNICSEIYPLIAKKYSKSTTSIERAMRLCFENALYNISKSKSNFVSEYMKDYLTFPHNSEVLCKITELVCSYEFQSEKNKLKRINQL